ncbi:g5182 [Coccomyxa elongata]
MQLTSSTINVPRILKTSTRLFCPVRKRTSSGRPRFTTRCSTTVSEYAIDESKRMTMNLLLLGASALPVGYIASGLIQALAPPKKAGEGTTQVAQDISGAFVTASSWLKGHKPGDHSLVQGLNGEPTYLVVTEDNDLQKFAINSVCTHLQCVVPWNAAENKFMCPCHGSQYNSEGTVVRGPAPLPLALAHVATEDDLVQLTQWEELDFRTGGTPWWK